MHGTNTQPPRFAPTLPVYPILRQIVRATGAAGRVYTGYVQQWSGTAFRDREPCYLFEPNQKAVAAGLYKVRLAGAYSGALGTLPLYVLSLACCPPSGSGFPPASASSQASQASLSPSVSPSASPSASVSPFVSISPLASVSPSASSSGVSSSSLASTSSGAGRVTPCCPGVVIPDNLRCTTSGGDCNTTVILTKFDEGVGNHISWAYLGAIGSCAPSSNGNIILFCNTDTGQWSIIIPSFTGPPVSQSCSPFDLVFDVSAAEWCCTDTRIEITV